TSFSATPSVLRRFAKKLRRTWIGTPRSAPDWAPPIRPRLQVRKPVPRPGGEAPGRGGQPRRTRTDRAEIGQELDWGAGLAGVDSPESTSGSGSRPGVMML